MTSQMRRTSVREIPSGSVHEERDLNCIMRLSQNLLALPSAREKENKKMGEEILDLLCKPTVKERSTAERFRSQGGEFISECHAQLTAANDRFLCLLFYAVIKVSCY